MPKYNPELQRAISVLQIQQDVARIKAMSRDELEAELLSAYECGMYESDYFGIFESLYAKQISGDKSLQSMGTPPLLSDEELKSRIAELELQYGVQSSLRE